MEIGLVGLPLTGKTTFFNLLTGMEQDISLSKKKNINVGIAQVPDERVDFLARYYKPQKTVYAQVQLKDIPGAQAGDAAGSPDKHLEEVRTADLLVQVVRAFQNDTVANIAGKPDPYRELADFTADLVIADMIFIEKRLVRIQESRKPATDIIMQKNLLQNILNALENEKRISDLNLSGEEKKYLAGHNFFTDKPYIIAVNMDDIQFTTSTYQHRNEIHKFAAEQNIPLLEICAQMEMEISQLPQKDQREYMHALGLSESGIYRLARLAYDHLGLIAFFTVGPDEVRAWTTRKGTVAKKAAGKIHSDMERGFIRAEVFRFVDLQIFGSIASIRERGLLRLEGRDYEVKDGDIINFRFNV